MEAMTTWFAGDGHASNSVVRTSPWGFGKRKRVGRFIIIGVVVQMDDERGSMIKGNNGDRWSSNSMMLLLRRWQN
jgi:hypothetical protein